RTFAEARDKPVDEQRLADAKANARYSFLRRLDNTETIAATLARFVRFERSYDTLNRLFRLGDKVTPADLQAAAKRYISDAGLVVTTLSHGEMPAAVAQLPTLGSLASRSDAAPRLSTADRKSALPQLNVKLLFATGSAYDPKGKEGLAALSAAMIVEGGSKERPIDEIRKILYPMAGSFQARVDKEMTTFTG